MRNEYGEVDYNPDPIEDDEDQGAVSGADLLGPNGPRLCRERCSTCIFRPGNRMQLRPGRVRGMVREALQGGGFITCHSTLPYAGTDAKPAICRGFYDSYGHLSNLIRIFGRLGGFDEIDPPSIKREC